MQLLTHVEQPWKVCRIQSLIDRYQALGPEVWCFLQALILSENIKLDGESPGNGSNLVRKEAVGDPP